MNIVLWIIAAVLAFAFIAAGLMKLATPREQLAAKMAWATDLSDGQVKGIGAVEVLGGIGVVLPALVDIAPVLVPIAAVGLAITMAIAAAFHVRRGVDRARRARRRRRHRPLRPRAVLIGSPCLDFPSTRSPTAVVPGRGSRI